MNTPPYYLVHANIAIARASLDNPIMETFISLAEKIDALAAEAPGFIATPPLIDEGQFYHEPFLLNVSIWESVDALAAFAYSGAHSEALKQRPKWFLPYPGQNYVLFWLPRGQTPTEKEIKKRLEKLEEDGPTPMGFTFDQPFSTQEMLAFKGRSSNESTNKGK